MKVQPKPFGLCIDNNRCRASLVLGKVYWILPGAAATKDDLVRVLDESAEDYLYHKGRFVFVNFPPAVKEKAGAPTCKSGHRPLRSGLLGKPSGVSDSG